MPCTTESLSDIRCNNPLFTSETLQRSVMLQFWCLIVTALDARVGGCAIADLLAEAETLACTGGVARQKMIQMQIICDNLDVDCSLPVCTQPDLMEAAISILVCDIVNTLSTPV